MPRTVLAHPLSLSTSPLAALDADLILIPVFEGEPIGGDLADVDQATGGAVGRALASREFQGKLYEIFLAPVPGWRA